MQEMKKTSYINSKIVGSTFRDNGQEKIQEIKVGDMLYLIPEPQNEYDSNAIRVCNDKFETYGYLPKGLAASMQDELEDGKKIWAIAGEVYEHNGFYGCSIKVYSEYI